MSSTRASATRNIAPARCSKNTSPPAGSAANPDAASTPIHENDASPSPLFVDTIFCMRRTKKSDPRKRAPMADEEDDKTLAAIDEGIRDAKAGRTAPIEEVRKRLTQWTTASSSRKER